MDKLDTIFEMQNAFDSELCRLRHLEGIGQEEWIQRETLAIVSELAELIDEVNFKWWKNPKPVDEDRVKDELIDVLHFFISMCIKTGMSAEELYQRYLSKNAENFARQQGKSAKEGYQAEI